MQRTTRDHSEIQSWAQKRGGQPMLIDHPHATGDKVGIRIDFPGETHEVLMSVTRPVSWDEFFRVFEEQELLLSYDDEPAGTDPTEWYHYEKRHPQEDSADEAA